jgi:hypothetical protein
MYTWILVDNDKDNDVFDRIYKIYRINMITATAKTRRDTETCPAARVAVPSAL